MEKFLKEVEGGDIHFRDRWQFELKSEFASLPDFPKSIYQQEIYLFVPNALQINPDTYTRDNFFLDQTNLIRYKTPVFTFDKLLDRHNRNSPLFRLAHDEPVEEAEDELKLLGNIVRSTLRERSKGINKYTRSLNQPAFERELAELIEDWKKFRIRYDELKNVLEGYNSGLLMVTYQYVDEYLSMVAEYYFIGILKHASIRFQDNRTLDVPYEIVLGNVITDEIDRRCRYFPAYRNITSKTRQSGEILYRDNLLNKFILDVLLLKSNRSYVANKHRDLIGSFAAGIAMFVFLVFFTQLPHATLANTEPYIFLTTILYILKDRLKEGLRSIPSLKAFRWLSDYKTEVKSPDESRHLGKIVETFQYLPFSEIPDEIKQIRTKGFHTFLETFQRPEQVMYYRKTVNLFIPVCQRLTDINVISRFNIRDFVVKAGEAYQVHSTIDEETQSIIDVELPKTYHLNIILKDHIRLSDNTIKIDIKRFRLILDKNGIKEVQQLD